MAPTRQRGGRATPKKKPGASKPAKKAAKKRAAPRRATGSAKRRDSEPGSPIHVTMGGVITHEEIPAADAKRREKVGFVARLMRELRWETGETGAILARSWGCSRDHVKQISAEAHRRVADEVTDTEVVGRTVSSALLSVIRQNLYSPLGHGVVVRAAKVWADIVGASAAIRIRVQEEPVESMTDEELVAAAKEAVALLGAKKGAGA